MNDGHYYNYGIIINDRDHYNHGIIINDRNYYNYENHYNRLQLL